jgi:hypothetical protein
MSLGGTRDLALIDGTVDKVLPAGDIPANVGDTFAAKTGFNPRRITSPYMHFHVAPQRIQVWREEHEIAGRDVMLGGTWLKDTRDPAGVSCFHHGVPTGNPFYPLLSRVILNSPPVARRQIRGTPAREGQPWSHTASSTGLSACSSDIGAILSRPRPAHRARPPSVLRSLARKRRL